MDEERDLTALEEALDAADVEGYVLDADGSDSNQRYLSGFNAPDAFVTLYSDGTTASLVSGLEYGRATKEAHTDTVHRLSEFDLRDLIDEFGREEARFRAVAAFLDEYDVSSVLAPEDFPLGTAEGLRTCDIDVAVDRDGAVEDLRAVKTEREIDHIRDTQRANERAMTVAQELLEEARPVDPNDFEAVVAGEPPAIDGDRPVLVEDGAVLTSERVREAIEVGLIREGCNLQETIVAGGADATEAHNRGSGPLRANEPIVIDIFPQDRESGYHADMTRTFVVGEPTDAAREFYELTREAQQAGLDAIEAGVTGDAVDAAVSDVYEDHGFSTLRSDEDAETGFIHGTGHGVGLDIHEAPTLAVGGEELTEGNVVTVEPGLYDPAVGGVRIEDLVVVTETGYENLTEYPIEFVID